MALTESDAIIRASQKAKRDSIVVSPKSAPELDAELLLALNETLRELRIEEENDVARAPTLRTGRAIKRARLDVYARIGIICHPVIARLVTDKGDTITTQPDKLIVTERFP